MRKIDRQFKSVQLNEIRYIFLMSLLRILPPQFGNEVIK